MAAESGGERPIGDAKESQIAAGRRLAASDGKRLAVRAELQIVHGAEDVSEDFGRGDGFQVPNGRPAHKHQPRAANHRG